MSASDHTWPEASCSKHPSERATAFHGLEQCRVCLTRRIVSGDKDDARFHPAPFHPERYETGWCWFSRPLASTGLRFPGSPLYRHRVVRPDGLDQGCRAIGFALQASDETRRQFEGCSYVRRLELGLLKRFQQSCDRSGCASRRSSPRAPARAPKVASPSRCHSPSR